MKIELELNDAETRALVGLLDIANKAGGLEVARPCVAFADKIAAARQAAAEQQPAEPTPDPDTAED